MNRYQWLVEQGKTSYLQALDEIGWFDLKQNNKDLILQNLEIFRAPVYCLYHLEVDMEDFTGDVPYRELLNRILQITQLKTESTNVSWDQVNNCIYISLVTEKNTYEYKIEWAKSGDWLEYHLITQFFNLEVLPNEGIESKFLSIPEESQVIHWIFVPESLFEKAIERGIIPKEPLR